MDLIKALYYDHYLDSSEFNRICNMREVVETNDAYSEYIKGLDVSQSTWWNLDNLAGRAMSAYEMRGFCMGVDYIMKMLASCGVNINLKEGMSA